MTDRIQALRDAFLKATRAVDTERAVLVTESYRANEDQSEAMKRALSMHHLYEKMTISIGPTELIVGVMRQSCVQLQCSQTTARDGF